MKRLIVIAILLSGACTRTPAPAESSYIASDDTAAMLLEMKPGEGHEVKGTLSVVGTEAGGKLTSGSRTFSGTIDGKAVNLSLENGTGITLATGVMTGDGLELTFLNNGVSAKMLFKPEPAEQFPKLVDQFRRRSAEQKQAVQQDALLAIQQKALSADQDGINRIAADLNAKAQAVADAATQVRAVAQSYAAMTVQTARLRTAEASAAQRLGPDDYRVGQFTLAREQMGDRAKNNHQAVFDLMARAREATARHEADVAGADQLCRAKSALDCSGVDSAILSYRRNVAELFEAARSEAAAFAQRRSELNG
ncbi:MAG TPA: hypothetical protein VGF77_02775 [Allosphingosinicella sp.]|jgi:hypothetical protein